MLWAVLFKVLSLSEDTAVVYWCRSSGSDGVCRPDSLVVEILARSPQTEISEERLRSMQQCGVNVCVKLENLQPTSQSEIFKNLFLFSSFRIERGVGEDC